MAATTITGMKEGKNSDAFYADGVVDKKKNLKTSETKIREDSKV